MPLILADIKAIVFDLGNTLVEFGPRQIKSFNDAREQALIRMFGSCDLERMAAIRDRQFAAPYQNGFKENDLRSIAIELIRELYNTTASEEQITTLTDARYNTFLQVVELPGNVRPLLDDLFQYYRLGLVSNYPCGRCIRDSLTKIGLTDRFETIVVSGEVGYVKPHPLPFATMLKRLNLAAKQCIYVGDTWLDDIQGAKRIGMQAIQTRQYEPYRIVPPSEGDYQPDAVIGHIDELRRLLI
ncbi:MAG: HAD family hydrolase [Planctomycetes bacterium]|nr:HAD family hydrolase [Planctomycetota bacterium]